MMGPNVVVVVVVDDEDDVVGVVVDGGKFDFINRGLPPSG